MIIKNQEDQICFTLEQIKVGNNIIRMWLNYAIWVRSLNLATVWNAPNLSSVRNRLSQVPMDFYNVLRNFWGDQLAEQFSNYMNNRIAIEGNLLESMIYKDQNAASINAKELYANSDEIAAFLSQFPNWNENEWQSLLYDDVEILIKEIETLLTGDYNLEITVFEDMIDHSLIMGSYMAYGFLSRNLLSYPINING